MVTQEEWRRRIKKVRQLTIDSALHYLREAKRARQTGDGAEWANYMALAAVERKDLSSLPFGW